jgi:hypothetical protein
MKTNKRRARIWNRCDACGRFVGLLAFEKGSATRVLVTPDSDRTAEQYETLCERHSRSSVEKVEADK